MLIFCMDEYETTIPTQSIPSSSISPFTSHGSVLAYPVTWSDTFGPAVYDHKIQTATINIGTEWNETDRTAEYRNHSLNTTPPDEVHEKIEALINEFTEGE